MKGASALVRMLLEYEVRYIFGVPGDTSLPLYEALYQAAGKIKHILARDERSATFMADAYARVSRLVGVCECPSGAGALYSAPGVAEANASSIPVILLTSGICLADEAKGAITELDHHKLYESITKWSSFVKVPSKIPETVRRAFRVATTGRPGAVHLAFPQEVLNGDLPPGESSLYAELDCRGYPAHRPRCSPEKLEALAKLLLDAQRVTLVAGGGALQSAAHDEVLELAHRLGSPVVTTISGQGILPDTHPLALGVIGDNGFHPHAIRAIREAQVLLYLGCKIGSVSTLRWTLPDPARIGKEIRIAQVDIDPAQLGNNYPNVVSICGDVKFVLRDLLACIKERASPREAGDWIQSLSATRRLFWEKARLLMTSDAVPLRPQRVIHELNCRLPEHAIVIADAGTPTPYITRYLRLSGPKGRFLIPRAYGGLGYSIPASVGAWLAAPKAKVVALFGDGSLGMSAGELETLVRLEVPVLLLHFNNGSFGWIKGLQSIHWEGQSFSVDFSKSDMSKVAAAFGLRSFRVTTPQELKEALDEALLANCPTFVDILSESEVDELPPVHSWLVKAGKDPMTY
jgi:acetolactate synthase-1/2/3 large subunit